MKAWAMRKIIGGFLLWSLLAICGFAHAGTVTYVYTDPQGTPLAEADASGNITATFEYTPYGTYAPQGTSAAGSTPNGPGYTGHVNDPETNLVYMQARYYDPASGRFLSIDPVTADKSGDWRHFNRYAYAYNNPNTFTDPDGRCPQCLFLIPVFVGLMTHSDYANAPGPGDHPVSLTTVDHLSAVVNSLPPGRMTRLIRFGITADRVGQKAADTSRAARRESMRDAGIPTSQQPVSQSSNASGREYSYDVPKEGGGTQRMSVQQQTMDSSHPDQPHWEAGKVKVDDNGNARMNSFDRPKLDNDKAKVGY